MKPLQSAEKIINQSIRFPTYAKATLILVGLFALLAMMYIARGIIVPLVFAIIIAVVLHPVSARLEKWGVHRLIAILTAIIGLTILMGGLMALMVSQVSRLSESWPQLVENFSVVINNGILWLSQYLDINPDQIHAWIDKSKTELTSTSIYSLGHTLSVIGTGLVAIFVVPVYVFLLLFYQPIIMEFIRRLFGPDHKKQVQKIITQIRTVIQSYLVGLVIETAIVATLNTAVLLILGIDYALLLGVMGALLNLIPYIGGLIAVALPMMVALATKTSGWYPLYVLGLYYVVQLIDNNYIVPVIVSSKVKINALFSIIVVFAGNALWGVPGMFLSIPLLAVIKLIFDQVEPLKPWGYLLGDNLATPPIVPIKPLIKKIIQQTK